MGLLHEVMVMLTSPPPRHFGTLQAGRGLAASMVVVHHVILFTAALEFTAGHLGVEFFFVLSGFVILMAHFDDIGKRETLQMFAWKRFRRLYPVYWIVLFPQLCFILARARTSNLYQRDPWTVVSNILLIHLHSTGVTVTVAWTLFHEILFYSFFALLILHRAAGSAVMAIWFLTSLLFFQSPHTYWGFFFSPLHLIFAMGMLAAWVVRRGPVPWPRALLPLGILLFAWAKHNISNSINTEGDTNNLLAGLGAMLAILGVMEFERRESISIPAWMLFLGDASYSIYLLHYPFIYAITPLTLGWALKHHLPLALWITSIWAASVLLGLQFHLWVERPLLRVLPKRFLPLRPTPKKQAA